MSKHGPCHLSRCPNPAIAWWKTSNGTYTHLCKPCLDCWFDNADDDPDLEPEAWGWFSPPSPPPAAIAVWATGTRNHQAVAEVIRREARLGPAWLRDFVRREQRMGRALALA